MRIYCMNTQKQFVRDLFTAQSFCQQLQDVKLHFRKNATLPKQFIVWITKVQKVITDIIMITIFDFLEFRNIRHYLNQKNCFTGNL